MHIRPRSKSPVVTASTYVVLPFLGSVTARAKQSTAFTQMGLRALSPLALVLLAACNSSDGIER